MSRSPPPADGPGPSELVALLVAANDAVDALAVAWRTFRAFRRVPVSAELLLGLRRSAVMPFQMPDDQSANVLLTIRDSHGGVIPAPPSPPVWSVSDDTLATITPSADGMSAILTVQPTISAGSFTVACSTGNLSGLSDRIDITPGAPAGATLELTLTPKASAEEAAAIHQGTRRHAGVGHHAATPDAEESTDPTNH